MENFYLDAYLKKLEKQREVKEIKPNNTIKAKVIAISLIILFIIMFCFADIIIESKLWAFITYFFIEIALLIISYKLFRKIGGNYEEQPYHKTLHNF